jgi:hypothetical protein
MGPKPRLVYSICTVAVRPTVTYAATVWWPAVEYKTCKAELSKLQRMAYLGITGAMRTPTAAIRVLLGLPPPHLQLGAEAKAGIYRLGCINQWTPRSEGLGHAFKTQIMERECIVRMGTDTMILSGFLTCEWKGGLRTDRK